MSRNDFVVQRIGVAISRLTRQSVLFHRGKVLLSRKYRVWVLPGNERFATLDPHQFRERFIVVQEYKPEEVKAC